MKRKIFPFLKMNLQRLFPEHNVCLFSEGDREKTWRIANVPPELLNHLRVWLLTQLRSPAIDLVEILENNTQNYDEVLAHRLGLSPIEADPLAMEPFAPEVKFNQPDLCTERTCLLFELNSENSTSSIRSVSLDELKWIPLGNQISIFGERPPRPFYSDLYLARLLPGQRIHLRAYAVLGTGSQHAKWSAVDPSYSPLTMKDVQIVPTCTTCEQIRVTMKFDPGFDCFYFTISLIGGLSFEDVERQLETRFDWNGLYPPRPVKYLYDR